MIRLAALFAVAAVACVGVAVAPPVTQEPVTAPHAITDPCIGKLPGMRAACCGHGVEPENCTDILRFLQEAAA